MHKTKNMKIIVLLLIVCFAAMPKAEAFWRFFVSKSISAISKSTKVLSESKIKELAKLSTENEGPKKVGRFLGKLKLPNEVLEDTYLRIAIYQKKLSRREAEEMFSRLSKTPGFRTTLRKIIGNSISKTKGHLNELKIANTASKNGLKVLAIGERFSDGIKRAPSDIDILLQKGRKIFAVEAKDYGSDSKIPMDKFKADLDTLVEYKKKSEKNIIPVFTITHKPNDQKYVERLEYEAKKRGVQLIFGNPQSQVEQIKMLGDIL